MARSDQIILVSVPSMASSLRLLVPVFLATSSLGLPQMGLRVAAPTQEEIKIVRERLTEIDKGILMEKLEEKKVESRSNLGK